MKPTIGVSKDNLGSLNSRNDPWVSFPNPKPEAGLRLFCLPHVGGGTSTYFPISKYLPADMELCLVRLPGRESRLKEPPFSNLAPLVNTLAAIVEPYLDRPFAIFGHSMGAIIGYELLSNFERRSFPTPARLFVSSRRAPHLRDLDPPLHHLPDRILIKEIQNRYNGIPDVVLQNPELLHLFLPTLRADLTLVETYRFESGDIACPITAFGGLRDERVKVSELHAWQERTRGEFRIELFPGGHFYFQNEEKALVQTILSDLPLR